MAQKKLIVVQDRMHLDCVFNIPHTKIALYVEEFMGQDAIQRCAAVECTNIHYNLMSEIGVW